MVSIYSIRKNTLSEENLLQVELRGLSTDDKPTELEEGIIENGSVFIEIDTGDVYLYDLENEVWEPVVEEPISEDEPNDAKKEEVKEEPIEEMR